MAVKVISIYGYYMTGNMSERESKREKREGERWRGEAVQKTRDLVPVFFYREWKKIMRNYWYLIHIADYILYFEMIRKYWYLIHISDYIFLKSYIKKNFCNESYMAEGLMPRRPVLSVLYVANKKGQVVFS